MQTEMKTRCACSSSTELEYEVVAQFVGNVYTVVRVKDKNSDKWGEGISRRSRTDKFSADTGLAIATGRAVKSLKKKLLKQRMHSIFMG